MGTHPIFESDFDCLTESELCSEVRPMASSMKRAQTFSSPQDGTRPRVPMRNQTMRLVRLCYISECQILKRFYWGSHIRMSHSAKGLQTLGWVTLMCAR